MNITPIASEFIGILASGVKLYRGYIVYIGGKYTTVPLTRKVTNLARRSRDTRETLACQNALLAREHSRALESTRNSKWVTRTRTLAGIYYSQEVIVASRVHTRVLFMIFFNSNPYARVWLHTQTQTHTACGCADPPIPTRGANDGI